MKPAHRAVVSLAVSIATLAASVLVVRGAYGAFSSAYPIWGSFSRAGEGLFLGAEVDYHGVKVGKVSSISLQGRHARVQMLIDPGFKVPQKVLATVEPRTMFGEEYVALSFPAGQSPPYLQPGGQVAATRVSDQLGKLFQAADPLLAKIDTVALSQTLAELDRASGGQGPRIAASIDQGAKLAGLLAATSSAQVKALDAFTAFNQAIAPTGPTLNAIAANSNKALPTFNAAAASYQRLLTSLAPLSANLAQLLNDYHPDIQTLLVQGNNVTRVLIARQANISTMVQGIYRYLLKFAVGGSPETLPNGSKFGYFKIFILFKDVNSLVCSLLAPTGSGAPAGSLAYLEPLQQAIAGSSSPLSCGPQFTAFAKAQAVPGAVAPVAAVTGTATSTARSAAAGRQAAPVPSNVAAAARNLASGIYKALSTPEVPGRTSLFAYMGSLLGGR